MARTASPSPQPSVLAALDISHYTPAVASYAGWAAQQMHAPLQLLHVAEGPSDVRDVQQYGDEEQPNPLETRLQGYARELGSDAAPAPLDSAAWMSRVAGRLREEFGISVDTRIERGQLLKVLQAAEDAVRIYVLGKRGEYADVDSNHLGSQLERVVRAVNHPVLVANRHYREPRRVLIAFDDSPTARSGIERIATSPLFARLQVRVLMVAEPDDASRAQLDWAVQTLRACCPQTTGTLRRGAAAATILREAEDTDLLVMGAYGRSRIRQFFVGSTTTHVLRTSQIPVLLLK